MNFVSTGLIKAEKTSRIVKKLHKNNITNIELSSGIYEKNLDKFLIKFKKKHKVNFLLHNYFPPPKKSFVFNLASNNYKIKNESIKLAKKAIELSKKLNCEFYSFHAGFLVDPKISSLGKKISNQKMVSRKIGLNNFLSAVRQLSKFAKKNKIELLIENNVLTQSNLNEFNGNPFLFVETDEIIKNIKKLPSNVKLLIDVGHLNVSSFTLKFDKFQFIKKCFPYIKAFHVSENNSLIDQNMPIKKNSWFLKSIKKKNKYSGIAHN